MRRLNKATEKKLYWFLIPFGILMIIFFVDLLRDNYMNYMEWGRYALLGSLDLFLIAYAIACIREKCWGLLIVAIFFIIWTWVGVVLRDNLIF